jgi:hypothetical protein
VALLGDEGAQDLIDYFDVLEAIAVDRLTWIDDAIEIERLEARLVSPVPEKVDDKDDFEETEQKDNFQQLPVSTFGMSFFSILCVNDFCMVVFRVFFADIATQRDDAGAI